MFHFDPPENQRFSDVFRGIKREHWEKKGNLVEALMIFMQSKFFTTSPATSNTFIRDQVQF